MVDNNVIPIKAPIFGRRHLQCFLMFWGLALSYALRVNLSLALIAMTDKNSANQDFPEYDWSQNIQSNLLSSFTWGYALVQVFGGYIARRFGVKISVFIGFLIGSILTILTPIGAKIGDWGLVFAIRFIEGMSQGVLFPATHTLLSKWAPKEERSVLSALSYSGTQFGTVIMMAASGFIATSPIGWPSIFYISGGCGVVWVLAWLIWGVSSPEECKSISISEKNLIEASLRKPTESSTNLHIKTLKTPWCQLVTSLPFLSLTLTHCAYSWVFWTLTFEMSSYMKNILGFNLKNNGLLSSLPYIAMLILGFVFTGIAGWLEKRNRLTLAQSRKLFNSISAWIPAVALVALGYVDAEHTNIAVALLVIAIGFGSAMHVGYQVNHLDLSPNFAGILMGFTGTCSYLLSSLAPKVVGLIVTDEDLSNPYKWRIVFFIAAGFSFIANLLFVIFGSADVQPWNEPEHTRLSESEPELTSVTNHERVH